jgi:hypothetical protein
MKAKRSNYLIDLKRNNCYNISKLKEEYINKNRRLKTENKRYRSILRRQLKPRNLANLRIQLKLRDLRYESVKRRVSKVYSKTKAGVNRR